MMMIGRAGGTLCVVAGMTGVRRHTAKTVRHSTAAVASSASAISGTPTAAVGPGSSRDDGENERWI